MFSSTNSFYGPRLRSHTRLIDAIAHVSEDGESYIVVVEPLPGGDKSDFEGMSDDESEVQMPEEVACFLEIMHRELESPSGPKSERPQRKKKKKKK